jgi:hypothetical protein
VVVDEGHALDRRLAERDLVHELERGAVPHAHDAVGGGGSDERTIGAHRHRSQRSFMDVELGERQLLGDDIEPVELSAP